MNELTTLTLEELQDPFTSGIMAAIEVEWMGRRTFVRKLSLDAQEAVQAWAKENAEIDQDGDEEAETLSGNVQMKLLVGMVLCNEAGALMFAAEDNPRVCDPEKVLETLGAIDAEKILELFGKVGEINGLDVDDEVKD